MDQPVLADGEVNYWGQPVAVVAADTPIIARRAIAAIHVEYSVRTPLVDPELAHERGSVFRTLDMRRGDEEVHGEVVVEGVYEIGMQDQAPLGTESGLALPATDGGVDIYVSTQWLHVDHSQIAASLALPDELVRVHPTGVGGAFGAREDLSLQIHLALLALRTRRPIKMVFGRDETFVGHVHRHPAKIWLRHEASRDGRLRRVEGRVLIDGGAFTSTTPSVLGNLMSFIVGPYDCETVRVAGAAVRTNNPSCGAMRGFGAPQACFAYEAQMDKLAASLGMDPYELRLRNVLKHGDRLATTGQLLDAPIPLREVLEALRDMPIPTSTAADVRAAPGGTGLTADPTRVSRGVGIALGIKCLAYTEGFDDYAEARVIVTSSGALVETAAAEVGQGVGQALVQIVQEVLGISDVAVSYVDTSAIGSAGSSSASRQTMMSGGAAAEAARVVRVRLLEVFDADRLDDAGLWRGNDHLGSLHDLLEERSVEHLVRFHHPPTEAPDHNGQGRLHADYAVAAHRAVVDVDVDLGLVRVISIDTAQDVGRVVNRQAIVGQIEGGIVQGMGLATMEELVLNNGRILNASFTDYLLPTFSDAPAVASVLLEEPSPWGPLGAKGVGEAPTVSSTAAIAAAIRDATGAAVNRVPVRPFDLIPASE
jgi:CO/xanthine dehydrogenase Mo-binding subunit